MVPFQQVPQALRVPLFYGEVNNTQANSAVPIQRTLIIGQKTNTGTGPLSVAIKVASTNDAVSQAGANSILAQLVDDYRLNDPAGEVYIGILHDDAAGAAATGTITFTSVATANGTYTVYLGGRKYQIAATSTMLVADLATALAAAINADKRATITATSSAGVVTLTADNKGPLHNDFPIVEYWYGTAGGEVAPAGLATTVVAMSGGTTPPSLTALLNSLGDKTFDFIVCPFDDSTSLGSLQQFLNDQVGRWSWESQTYGHVFSAHTATGLSGLTTYGNSHNDQHLTTLGWKNAASPAWRLAAAYCGAVAPSLRNLASQPTHSLPVFGMMPPKKEDRFQLTDRNQLLYNGVSTFTVDDDGTLRVDKLITTYQQNSFAQADDSYLNLETMFTIMACLRALRTAVTSKWPRALLAADGTPVLPGTPVVTPAIAKSELIAQYRTLCLQGLCQQPDVFKAGLIVEINAQNANRLDVLYDPVLMGQLDIFAVLFQFRKQ